MEHFKAIIQDPIGLHARPASLVVQVASKFESQITINSGTKSANLKSIMNVMALGVLKGDEVEVTAQGSDASLALSAIKTAMVDNKLI